MASLHLVHRVKTMLSRFAARALFRFGFHLLARSRACAFPELAAPDHVLYPSVCSLSQVLVVGDPRVGKTSIINRSRRALPCMRGLLRE